MAGSKIKAGEAFVELGIKNRIQQGAKAAQADLDKMARRFTGAGATAIAAASAALAPLAAATMNFASAGDRLDKMSKRTGIAVEALSELAFAAEQSGADLGAVELGMKGMSAALFNASRGSAEVVSALEAVGLVAKDLENLTPEEQFTLLADRLSQIEDPTKKSALAMKLFGEAGLKLVPMFNESAKGIAALRAEAGELGRTMTKEDAASAAALTDAMNRMKSVMAGLSAQIGAALAPAFTEIADVIAKTSSGLVDFARENKGVVQAVAAVAVAVGVGGAAFVSIGGSLFIAKIAVSGFAAALTTLSGAAVLFNPIGLAVAGVAAALSGLAAITATVAYETGLMGAVFKGVKDTVGSLLAIIKTTMSGVSDALATSDWELAAQIAMAGVNVAIVDGFGQMVVHSSNGMEKVQETITGTFKRIINIVSSAMGTIDTILRKPWKAADAVWDFGQSLKLNDTGNNGVVGWAVKQRLKAGKELDALIQMAKDKKAALAAAAGADEAAGAIAGANGFNPDAPASGGSGASPSKTSDAFAAKARALELEIIAMEKGEAAADRLKMADEGLTAEQIKQIEILREKKKLLEETQKQQEELAAKMSSSRVADIFKKGSSLAEQGMSPDEVFKRVMAQIATDQKAGVISKDDAASARETAKQNLDNGIDQLRQQGKALADALRTPGETLSATLAEISKLQDGGFITEQTALRAEDKARQEFRDIEEANKKKAEEQMGSIDNEQSRTGPSATFSAAAASIIGMGGGLENEQLKAAKETAANTKDIAKQARKNNIARFA